VKSFICGYHFHICLHLGDVEQDKTHHPCGAESQFQGSSEWDLGLLKPTSWLLCTVLPRVTGNFFVLISETTDHFTTELSDIMCRIPLSSAFENWLVFYIDVLNKTASLTNCTLCWRDSQWLSCNWYVFL